MATHPAPSAVRDDREALMYRHNPPSNKGRAIRGPGMLVWVVGPEWCEVLIADTVACMTESQRERYAAITRRPLPPPKRTPWRRWYTRGKILRPEAYER